MALIFIRTAIIFLVLLLIMRLMGKSQIGEMQPFEFVISLVIAELACIPMADSSIPLLYGVIAIVTIFILHQVRRQTMATGSALQAAPYNRSGGGLL